MNIDPLVDVMKPRRIAPIQKFTEFLASIHYHTATFYSGIYLQTQQHPISHMVGEKPHDVLTVFPFYCPEETYYEYLGLGSMTKGVRLTPKGKKFVSDGSDHIITVFEVTEHDLDFIERIVIEKIKQREEFEKEGEAKKETLAPKS